MFQSIANNRSDNSNLRNLSIGALRSWSPLQGAGRSAIAFSQILILLFTSSSNLSPDIDLTSEGRCTGIKSASAYCLIEGNEQTVSYIFSALLILVIAGYFPFLISALHLYITLCLTNFITVPDGGDSVAVLATIALLLLSLADNRRNHWYSPKPRSTALGIRVGIGIAAAWGLRFQLAYIYLNAAIAKLSPEEWRTGTAFYYITKSEMFGAPDWLMTPIDFMVSIPIITIAFTWGTILFESLMALIFAIGSVKARRIALACSIVFHIGIALIIGIASFAVIMIGIVIVANSDVYQSQISPLRRLQGFISSKV